MGHAHDYWDLMLACIYNHYPENEVKIKMASDKEYSLSWLLGNMAEVYAEWLENFKLWKTFVESNFLQDFVNQAPEGYGPPKELWQGHFFGSASPKDDQIEDFFTNAAACISARSRRMVIALRAKVAKKETNQ